MVLISKSKVKKQQGCESLQGRRGIEHRAANVANAIAASNLWNFEKNGLSFAASHDAMQSSFRGRQS